MNNMRRVKKQQKEERKRRQRLNAPQPRLNVPKPNQAWHARHWTWLVESSCQFAR